LNGVTAGAGDVPDRIAALRVQLEQLEQVPLDERVALFDRANTTISRELAELDEV
jgi:hypothetical protein